jgi:hypothetical protein
MAERRVRIRFLDPEKSEVHRIRNMGEDLWRELRDDPRYRIALEEIDRATDVIEFSVRESLLKRALSVVEDVLKEHMMSAKARIEVE